MRRDRIELDCYAASLITKPSPNLNAFAQAACQKISGPMQEITELVEDFFGMFERCAVAQMIQPPVIHV